MMIIKKTFLVSLVALFLLGSVTIVDGSRPRGVQHEREKDEVLRALKGMGGGGGMMMGGAGGGMGMGMGNSDNCNGVVCDDFNPCTDDSCDPNSGECVYTSIECENCKCATRALSEGELGPTFEGDRLLSTIERVGGNPDGSFLEITDPLLSVDQCSKIRDYADNRLLESIKEGMENEDEIDDFWFMMSADGLMELIGAEPIQSISKVFKEFDDKSPVSQIIIRRTKAEGDKHLDWHLDPNVVIMNVWLNDGDVSGGQHRLLTRSGEYASGTGVGTALCRDHDVVHAVAEFTGTRYVMQIIGSKGSHIRGDMLDQALKEQSI